MCWYPELIINPKYRANKKNGGVIPAVPDERVKYVPIGCGRCAECRKSKAREWKIRLTTELREEKNWHFYTLTFNEESYAKWAALAECEGYARENKIATMAVRSFLELHRKHYKKALRHWLITELGQTNTERVHLHGIIQTELDHDRIATLWKNGYSSRGQYCNSGTANYITKYLTKVDVKHAQYKPVILTSPGIGKLFVSQTITHEHKYKGEKTADYYLTQSGNKLPLPIYYRNKLYTETEREQLWIHKLDKGIRYVMGQAYKTDSPEYYKALHRAQRFNKAMGYELRESYEEEQHKREQRILKYKNKKNNIK